jgi:hypothetical protein
MEFLINLSGALLAKICFAKRTMMKPFLIIQNISFTFIAIDCGVGVFIDNWTRI